MTKQIKQLGSNHQLMVKDTKTGKTFVINKDDASLGDGDLEITVVYDIITIS